MTGGEFKTIMKMVRMIITASGVDSLTILKDSSDDKDR